MTDGQTDQTPQDEYPKVSSEWQSNGDLIMTIRRQRYVKTQFKLHEGELPGVIDELEEQVDAE